MEQLPPMARDTVRSAATRYQVGQWISGVKRLHQIGAVGAHLDAQRALTGGRQGLVRFKNRANAALQPQPLEAGRGQHDGVVAALVELAQAGVQVAAQGFDAHILDDPAGPARHAATPGDAGWMCPRRHRAADRPRWRTTGRHPGIARVFALHHASQAQNLRANPWARP